MASSGRDKDILLWDLQNLDASPAILKGHTNWVNAVAFNRDGSWLASGGRDNLVRLWPMRHNVSSIACNRAGRNLSIEEWRSLFGSTPYEITCKSTLPHLFFLEAMASRAAETEDYSYALAEYIRVLSQYQPGNLSSTDKAKAILAKIHVAQGIEIAETEVQKGLSHFKLATGLNTSLPRNGWGRLCLSGISISLAFNKDDRAALQEACDIAVENDDRNLSSRAFARLLVGDYDGVIPDLDLLRDKQPDTFNALDAWMRGNVNPEWIRAISEGTLQLSLFDLFALKGKLGELLG